MLKHKQRDKSHIYTFDKNSPIVKSNAISNLSFVGSNTGHNYKTHDVF
jgi:hypothetical protein